MSLPDVISTVYAPSSSADKSNLKRKLPFFLLTGCSANKVPFSSFSRIVIGLPGSRSTNTLSLVGVDDGNTAALNEFVVSVGLVGAVGMRVAVEAKVAVLKSKAAINVCAISFMVFIVFVGCLKEQVKDIVLQSLDK